MTRPLDFKCLVRAEHDQRTCSSWSSLTKRNANFRSTSRGCNSLTSAHSSESCAGSVILMFGYSACQEELAGCSPMAAMMSPALCESAHLERATKYPVSLGAAQRPATVGCKRKARRDQATPDSTAAPLSDCLNQSGRASGADSLSFRWAFYCLACLHKILRSFIMRDHVFLQCCRNDSALNIIDTCNVMILHPSEKITFMLRF